MGRSLLELHPETLRKVAEQLRIAASRGVAMLVVCTVRDRATQQRLWEIGRELKDGEWVRVAGASIATKARPGWSYHEYGLAIDAAPYMPHVVSSSIRYKLDWTPFANPAQEHAFRESHDLTLLDWPWRVMVEAGDEAGLEWAGRWRSMVEYCHWQDPQEPIKTLFERSQEE